MTHLDSVPFDLKNCPYCRQNAPVVHRGVLAYCTACNRPRAPFAAASVSLAGQPSKVGGTLATVVGGIVTGVGLTIALAVGLLLQALWPGAAVVWGLSGIIGVVSLALGLALIWSGQRLRRSGDRAAQSARVQAVQALASHRGGILTAKDVALALAISEEEADRILTELVSRGDDIAIDVDDDGLVSYRFGRILPPMDPRAARARVDLGDRSEEAEAEVDQALPISAGRQDVR